MQRDEPDLVRFRHSNERPTQFSHRYCNSDTRWYAWSTIPTSRPDVKARLDALMPAPRRRFEGDRDQIGCALCHGYGRENADHQLYPLYPRIAFETPKRTIVLLEQRSWYARLCRILADPRPFG